MPLPPLVLVVDDDRINRLVLRRMVEVCGCRVEESDQGDAARQRVLAGGIDLVLMDILMPVMDGFQAAQAIRRAGCVVAVVGISAMDDGQLGAMARGAGMNDCILKPIRLRTIEAVLARWLGGQPAPPPA